MKKLMLVAVLTLISIPNLSQVASASASSLEFGLSYQYYDYKEDLPAPLKSTESGWLPGVYLGYTYKKKSAFFAKIYGDYVSGDITFDGTTMGGTPISFSDSRQMLLKIEADFGYTFGVKDNFLLIPYVGYGYRYWERGRSRTTSTYTEYEEDYYWSYIPIGLKADYDINERWNIGGTIALHIMFNGKMKTGDTEFDLGNKMGFYADLPVTYKLTSNWSIVGTPWYEYSEIGQSNIVAGYYEPASKTNQYGFKLGASYSF